MNKVRHKLFLFCTVIAITGHTTTSVLAKTENDTIRFGSVAMDVPAVMEKRLLPLSNYLSARLKMPVVLKLATDMPMAINEISKGAVEISYLTPVAYLRAHEQGGAQLVAKTITLGKASFKLMIVVREDSPIKSIADLTGKTFAFGDRAALLQRAAVVGSGMPLEQLGSYDFLGHYDNIVRAVLNKDFDAGILKDTMAYKWQGKGIRILYATPDLPPYNIAASKNVDPKTLHKLQNAFLELNLKNPDHLPVIKALDKNYSGFASTSDTEYDIVRKLIKPFDR